MIKLSRLNGHQVVVNAHLIKFVESTPDTLLTLTTGDKFMVQEDVEEVMERVVLYRQRIQLPLEQRSLEIDDPEGL
jgi:flagellar protein FlbD